MSASEDDYENALWNNQFYSSPAVLTESSSTNHISNLRKSVNLPTSASVQSLNGYLVGGDPENVENGGKPHGSMLGAGVKNTKTRADKSNGQLPRARAMKTSLMKVSPSMKALESILNDDPKPVYSPEAIVEEEDEENADPEPKPAPNSRPKYDLQFQQPGSRASAFSLSTFHTAKSTDTFYSTGTAQTHLPPQPQPPSRQASTSTLELPGYSLDDSAPKFVDTSLVASLQSAEDDEEEEEQEDTKNNLSNSEKLPSQPQAYPKNTDLKTSTRPKSTLQREFSDLRDVSLASKRLSDSPLTRAPKSMVPSSSCPALSDRHRYAPRTSQDHDDTDSNSAVSNSDVNSRPSHDIKEKDLIHSAAQPPSPKKQAPVRSLLDSPFIVSSKSTSQSDQAEKQKPVSPLKSSSAFGTPRPQQRYSPRKSNSDVGVPKSPSFYGYQRSASDGSSAQNLAEDALGAKNQVSDSSDTQKSDPLPEIKQSNHKRFSFRGLFKIKSKNHSLSKLGGIEEELKHGSRPVKLSSKSFSTPNMSALTKEEPEPKHNQDLKADSRKRFFGRKSGNGAESAKDTASISDKLDQPVAPTKPRKSSEATLANTPQAAAVHSPVIPAEPVIATPATPVRRSSNVSVETPSTAYLAPKRETIREVDDSDYSPNLTEDSLGASKEAKIKASNYDHSLEEQQRDISESPTEISPYIPKHGEFNSPSTSESAAQFGSPFRLSFQPERFDAKSTSPILRYQPPQSPNRSLNSRASNEQLFGETLFPKSLSAQEVESIVSLERSRSMRSIRSSNKRSSFLNYHGSDENIILGKNLANTSQNSMKRSGSILKNSPSNQSLKLDMYNSIDTAFDNLPSPDILQNQQSQEMTPVNNDIDFGDFIEFTDYIDFDNLDFSTSPVQEPYRENNQMLPSPSLGIYYEDDSGFRSSLHETTPEPEPHSEFIDTTSVVDTTTAIDTTASLGSPDKGEVHQEASSDDHLSSKNQEMTSVISHRSESEVSVELSEVSPDITNISLEPTQNASPLNKTFEFVIDDNKGADETRQTPRPISMSFKGFSGSAFKDKFIPQSGSHQSIHFDEESGNEGSTVGQGFGTSDEDSEEENESYEGQEDYKRYNASVPETKKAHRGPRKMSSFDRRQQHIKNRLELQPPSSSLPFHHNRIPSISDQSSVSSPKSLTSFISRIRKSPMTSPNLPAQRPTVKFSSRIILYDTYHHDEYDRHPEIATCNQLTPLLAQQIKEELNELKSNMEIHEDSIGYTQFF
ncbi:hypothetical protein JCM33374_g6040 [Metschnikowia sp. JCM 33374]|nr:hypothetical protein JCM33374_g6040 [Metschnikowia sp. JCM 33374]